MWTIEKSAGISVYDSSGTLLRVFSRRGQGPGEHESARVVVATRGDTVHLFDNALRRYTVFSPSYDYVRSLPYPGRVWQAVEMSDGSLAVNADFSTPDRVGFPLHRLNRDGSIAQSYGTEVEVYRADSDFLLLRYISVADRDRIWAVSWVHYQPTLWSPDQKVAELQRLASWFPPVETPRYPGLNQPPTPWVHGIWMDRERQQLWTMLRVPDAKWAPQPGAQAGHSGRARPVIRWDREYDTIVEVIDLATGRLLATQRYDEALWQLVPGGYVTRYREAPDGEPFLDVWQLRIVTPSRR